MARLRSKLWTPRCLLQKEGENLNSYGCGEWPLEIRLVSRKSISTELALITLSKRGSDRTSQANRSASATERASMSSSATPLRPLPQPSNEGKRSPLR